MEMKRNKEARIVLNTVQRVMATFLLVMVLASCSKDDAAPESSIRLGALSLSENGDCNHSSGVTGTSFGILIPYSGTQDDTLIRILYKLIPEGGDAIERTANYNDFSLKDGSGEMTWNSCLRFFDVSFIDLEIRIETADGIISSVSKIKINKPDGAN